MFAASVIKAIKAFGSLVERPDHDVLNKTQSGGINEDFTRNATGSIRHVLCLLKRVTELWQYLETLESDRLILPGSNLCL